MKIVPISATLLLMISAATSPPLRAADPAAPTPVAPAAASAQATPVPAKKKASLLKLDYKAPAGALGAPAVRETGGTRGADDKLPAIYVLAPNHVALTTQAQPVLFWYQGQASKAAFKLSLVEPKKPEPLVSATMEKAEKKGINALKLSDWKVTLKPGVEYRWNVSLIPNPDHPSDAKYDSGVIKRIEPPKGLEDQLANTSLAERAVIYAQAGLWYDALESISTAIAAEPNDASLHKLRAMLLKQGGLPEVAGAER